MQTGPRLVESSFGGGKDSLRKVMKRDGAQEIIKGGATSQPLWNYGLSFNPGIMVLNVAVVWRGMRVVLEVPALE